LFLIGRVKPGVPMASLQEKMSGLLRQSLGELKDFQTVQGKTQLAKAHVVLTPGGQGVANMQHRTASSLYLLMGLAGMVLLIACAKHRQPDAGARVGKAVGNLDSYGARCGEGKSDTADAD